MANRPLVRPEELAEGREAVGLVQKRRYYSDHMDSTLLGTALIVVLILLRLAAGLWLDRLNRHHVAANAAEVPDAFSGMIDPGTYKRAVEYTLAKSRFGSADELFNTGILLIVLFSGLLPETFQAFSAALGKSFWSMAACIFTIGAALSVTGLPAAWYAQFRLEERFGFNTTTQTTWWMDRAKGFLLAAVLGYPLLALILALVQWTGPWWWVWGWAVLMAFQLFMLVLGPVLILPLFNKFTPLPAGGLRERLLNLADRTGFRAQSIQVMDGSRRSRHSNAFFTGFGRLRKIVLFDTLIQQLTERELESVLAHEIGHYKRGHIPRMLILAAGGSFAGFYVLSLLARQDWFYQIFGFDSSMGIAPALLLFGLLSGVVTFWMSPLANWLSRRHEYQADAFAANALGEPDSLIGALRKLNEKNLSNLTPHPAYSTFHYSHPTLLERERALRRG